MSHNLNNLYKYLKSEGHLEEANYVAALRKEAFEWPWETWNNLPAKPKEELMDLLDKISYIPIIGVGGDAAKFVLSLYSGDYAGAARSLVMVVISFVLQVKMAGKILTLQKASGSLVKDFFNITLKTNRGVQGEIIGMGVQLVDSQLDSIASMLSGYKTEMMIGLSSGLSALRGGLKATIEKEIGSWLMRVTPPA
jgi:hypothetical protein